MSVRLVFLGKLADLAGRAEAEFDASAPLDWYDVFGWCRACYSEALSEAIQMPQVRLALNGELVTDKEGVIVTDGDELAFLPPVSGG